MSFELVSSSHCIGESNLHLQFTPAYRRAVFARRRVKLLVRAYFFAKAEELRVKILALDFGPDHVHLFLSDWKNYAVEKLVQLLKGFTSYMMRKNHLPLFKDFLWGKKFWSNGYFYRTVGSVTTTTIRIYITQSQNKHWKKNNQTQLNAHDFKS